VHKAFPSLSEIKSRRACFAIDRGQSSTRSNRTFGSVATGPPISYPTYDWVDNDGRTNIGIWIEAAAKKAGR
jgi:hypothetical protein